MYFLKYLRKRTNPLFSKTEKGEKLKYFFATQWNTMVFVYFGFVKVEVLNRALTFFDTYVSKQLLIVGKKQNEWTYTLQGI
jgi:hypothetical protein